MAHKNLNPALNRPSLISRIQVSRLVVYDGKDCCDGDTICCRVTILIDFLHNVETKRRLAALYQGKRQTLVFRLSRRQSYRRNLCLKKDQISSKFHDVVLP